MQGDGLDGSVCVPVLSYKHSLKVNMFPPDEKASGIILDTSLLKIELMF